MSLVAATENKSLLGRLFACQPVCKVFTVVTIVLVLLTLNTVQFSKWTLKFTNVVMTVVENETMPPTAKPEMDSNSNLAPMPPSNVVHSLWQFEPTKRLYDNRTDVPTKVVLLWTTLFIDWPDHFDRNHGPYAELEVYNSSKRCYFTRNRTYLERASALMFLGLRSDFNFDDLPQKRFPWQRWVFYLLESPLHGGFDGNDNEWNKANALQFNWTMTYSKLGNVYSPYGYVRRLKQKPDLEAINAKIIEFAKSFKSRPKDGVWVVSNCGAPSMRQNFVEKLKALGLTIDTYGNCGGKAPDDEWKEKGEKQFFSRYRFVFALENSLCQDYITEKAFHAFYANFIAGPIVIIYNGANNSDFFPNGSYIDLRSFKNISDLATLMKSLSNSDENSPELLRYYDWHKDLNPGYERGFELETISDMYAYDYAKRAGWRNLCRALWDKDTGTNEMPVRNYKTSYVLDIRKQLGTCFLPDLTPLGRVRRQTFMDDKWNSHVKYPSWRGLYANGSARLVQL